MKRAVSLFLPMWDVDLERRRHARHIPAPRTDSPAPSAPVLLIRTVGQREIVAACCERAAAAGVHAGMTCAHARALLPLGDDGPGGATVVLPHSPERAARSLRKLAEWCERLAPVVAVDEPDGLMMDLSGCERSIGGDTDRSGLLGARRLVLRIARSIERIGFRTRVAMAPTFGCARALARFGAGPAFGARFFVRDPADLCAAMRDLPVASLGLPEMTVAAMAEVGIDHVGDLLRLPRRTLPVRFGEETLMNLDRALGLAIEPLEPVRPVAPPVAHRVFEGPSTRAEALERAAREAIEELCTRLEHMGRGVSQLHLVIDSLGEHGTRSQGFPLRLSRPSRSPKHLWTLAARKLEGFNMGFGVEGVHVTAITTGPVRAEQAEWLAAGVAPGGGEPDHDGVLAEMVDVLNERLGPDRVLRPRTRQSHLPERAFALAPACSSDPPTRRLAHDAPSVPGPRRARTDRPLLLLRHPERIEVMALVPDGPPIRMRWRGWKEARRIVSWQGPERISEEWWTWEPLAPSGDRSLLSTTRSMEGRDYFKVEDEKGRWLWIFRRLVSEDAPAGPAEWFVHGEWA